MDERKVKTRVAHHGPNRRRRTLTPGRLVSALLVSGLAVGAFRLGLQRPLAVEALDAAGDASTVEVLDEVFALPRYDKAALEPFIQEAAGIYGVSADLVRAVIQVESQFNPTAVSPVGARGLMQLMPSTAEHLGVEDTFDPRQNIHGGVKYLSVLLDRFNGNTALALAGYNAGPTVVSRYRTVPPFRETQGYVKKIQRLVADTSAAFTIPRPRLERRTRTAHYTRASRSLAARVGRKAGQQGRVVRASASRSTRKPGHAVSSRQRTAKAKVTLRAARKTGTARKPVVVARKATRSRAAARRGR